MLYVVQGYLTLFPVARTGQLHYVCSWNRAGERYVTSPDSDFKAEMLQQAGDGMDFQLIVLVGYSLSLNSAWALAGHVVAFCVNVTMV